MVYSPPPCGTGYPSCGFALWNRISLCFCGIPSPTAAVLCCASCGIPSPHRAGQGGRRTRPPPPVEQDGFPFCHTHITPCLVNVWPFYLPTLLWHRMVFPHIPVMYSCTSISNGCHGVFSPAPPPPVEQDIAPAVLWFSNCACGPGRKENPPPAPPPLWNRMVSPPYTHTHTMSL